MSKAVTRTPGITAAGMNTFQLIVWPQITVSHDGNARSMPSRKPMYQSGWEPAVTWSGTYGP